MSLTKKLILAFLLVTVVPLGVVIYVSHRTFLEYAERQVGNRLEDSVSSRRAGASTSSCSLVFAARPARSMFAG
jgi:hypothetical protein